MLSFWENGYLFYVAAVLCLLGAVAKWLASQRYKKLIKQGDTLGNAKDKQLKLLKGRFENAWRVNGTVANTGIFVDKALMEYRFLWTSLERFDHLGRQLGIFLLFLGGLSAYVGYRMGLSAAAAWEQLYIGAGFTAVLFLWDLFLDTRAKRRELKTVLCNYFENSWSGRLNRPALEGPHEPCEAAETKAEMEDEVAYLKESLDRIASDREVGFEEGLRRRLTTDEERVIKEIIKEYLI